MCNPLKTYLNEAGRGAAAELARALNVSRGYIGDIASGRREPPLKVIRQIDEATDGAVEFAMWKTNPEKTQ